MIARRLALVVFLGVVLAVTAQAQSPTAPALLNSNALTDTQVDERPQIISDGAGTWISVWDSYDGFWQAPGPYGSDADIWISRSTNNGATWSAAVPLNPNAATDSGEDVRPFIATDGVGNYVVVWSSNDLGGAVGPDYDLYVSRSSNNAVSWTAPARLNSNGASDSGKDDDPKVATDGLGNWVAMWDANSNISGSGTDADIFVTRSIDNGATWTAPALVNSNGLTDSGSEGRVELVTDGIGNWVAAWTSRSNLNGTAGADAEIVYSRSTNNGLTWSAAALLNSTGIGDTGDDKRPGLATNGAGAWVAVWNSNFNSSGSGSDYDIRVARSSDFGQTWTAPVLLNSNGTSDSGLDDQVRVVSDGTGNWLAVWTSTANYSGSGTDNDIWFSRSTDNGQTWSALSLINTNGNVDGAGYYDLVPQLATDGAGNWVGVWESNDPASGKGTDWDILTTRFTLAPLTIAASSIVPATSGPTNATSVGFSVGFSQPVVNFNNVADLAISHSGTANSGVAIAGGPQNYTVTVSGLSGTGSFTLAVSTASDVQASGGGALTSSVTSSAVSIDNTIPSISLSSAAGDPVGGAIGVTVSLSESSANFSVEDISATNATVLGFSGSGTSYSFTLSPLGNGLFGASVAAGAFTDAAGNSSTASNSLSRTAVIVSPSIILSSGAGDPVSGAISVNASLSSSSANFVSGDVTPSNATVSNFTGSGASYSFTLTPTTSGLFSAAVAAGAFTDAGANPNLVSNTLSRTADLVAPTATLASAAGDPVNGAISATVTLSESSGNFAQGDVSVVNAAVSNFSGSAASYSFTLTPTSSGLFSASVPAGSFSDAAGNLNPVSNTLSRTADLIAPTITLSTVSGDPVTGSIGVSVTLSESSSNFASGDIVAANGIVSGFSGSGTSYSFSLTPVVSGPFSATVNAGTFTDAAGNNNTASNTLSRTANLPNGAGFSPTPQALLNSDATTDSRTDERPQIETDGAGNWVVIWDVFNGPTGSDLDIFVSRSTDNGSTWSAPLPLNTNAFTDNNDDLRPALATDRAGNWVAVWYSNENLNGTAGYDYDIFYSRSTNAGQTWSAPAVLNTNGTTDFGDDEIPRIAVDNAGNWVVVWDSNENLGGLSGGDYDVFVSRSSNGTTWTAPALLNSNATTDSQNDNRTEILTDRLGNWVVLWASNASLGAPPSSNFDIFVSRSSDNGATWAAMTRVDSNDANDTGDDARPALGTDGQGNWVAAWHANDNLGGLSGNDTDIFTSRSTNNGATWTTGALLNTNGNSDLGLDEFVRLMSDGAGNWIAIWDSSESLGGLNGTDYDVFISRSTNNGLTWTAPTIVNSNANVDSGFDLVSQVATNELGDWVAVWESQDSFGGQAGTEWDIHVSRFTLSAGLSATGVVPVTVGPTNASSVNFNVSFSGSVVNFNNAGDLVITHTGTANSGVTISGGPQNYVVSVTGISGNGSFTVAASTTSDIQGSGGNPLVASVTSAAVAIDTTAPTIALSSGAPSATNSPVAVTAILSESSTTFAADDITLVNASLSGFAGSGTNYSFTITPLATGTFSASVATNRFTDVAGNNNSASNLLSRTADLDTPSITLSSAAASVVTAGIAVTATLSETSTDFTSADVSVVNATVSGFTGSGVDYSFTLTPLADGLFSAQVVAGTFTDATANPNIASNTLSRTADLTAPTIVLASVAGNPVAGSIAVTVTLSEASTDFASGDVTRVNCNISGFSGSGANYSFTITPTTDGVFSATVNAGAFTDAAGNTSIVSNTLSRTADVTRPTITLSSPAASSVNGPFTVNATLSEASADFAAADVTPVNGAVGDFTGSGTSYSFTLTPAADGTTSASVAADAFTDAVGNTNTASNTLSRTANLSAPSITLSSAAASVVTAGIAVTATLSDASTDFTAADVTSVNATVSGFSGSGVDYSFTLTPLADGLFSAEVAEGTFADATANLNTASNTLSRTADQTAPTIVLASVAGNPVNGAISVTATLSEASTDFASGDVTRVNCSISGFSGSGANYSFTITPTTDGAFSATVDAGAFTDVAGNTSVASNTLSRTADVTQPTIILSSPSAGTVNGPFTVNATLSEVSVDFAAADVTPVNGALSNFTGSGTSYSFTLTPAADGTTSVSVAAGAFTDAVGNTNTVSNALSRTADLSAPSITLNSAAASVVRVGIAVTATLSETSTDFTAADVTPVNAAVSDFSGSGASYSFTLTPLASGLFSATVNASTFTDATANPNTVSNTLSRTADLTAPTIVLASVAGNPVNGAISVTATLSEASTNFASGDVTRVNCNISGFSGSGASYSFTLTPSASGAFSATVNAGTFSDAVGNSNSVSNTLLRTFDNTRPTITLSSSTPTNVNGPIAITAVLSEASVNFVLADITSVNGTLSNFTGSGATYSFTLTPLADGTTSATVAASTFTDAAGNTNTASNTLSRTADLTVPTLTLTSSAASLVRAPISVTVRLSQSSTNFASGDIAVVNASVSAFSGSGRNYGFTLTPLADGLFSAQVPGGAFTDAAGNGNIASSVLSRTADITPPTATLSSTASNPVAGAIVVTVVLTESSTNFTSADVTRVNCSISGFTGSGANYSFTLTPTAAGLFTATIPAARFTDAAGNNNTASNTLSRTRS